MESSREDSRGGLAEARVFDAVVAWFREWQPRVGDDSFEDPSACVSTEVRGFVMWDSKETS